MAFFFLNVELGFVIDVLNLHMYKGTSEVASIVLSSICQHYSVDIMSTPRLLHAIKRYLIKPKGLISKIRKSKQGGKQRSMFIEWLKVVKTWQLKILQSECHKLGLLDTIKQLKKENRKITSMKQNLEKVMKKNRGLKLITEKYKKRAMHLSMLLRNKQSCKRSAWRKKEQYSRRHTRRLSTHLKEECQARLQFLDSWGVHVKHITIRDANSGQLKDISLIDDTELCTVTGCNEEKILQNVNLAVLVKDAHGISNESWNSLASICNLPNLTKVKTHMKDTEMDIPMSKTKSSNPGVQRDMKVLLKKEIEHLVSKGILGKGKQNVDVKITGDGTVVGHWHYVNVTCTVLNDEANATSASGHRPIAILCDEEKYSQLKEHLVDIVQDVASFTSLVIDDVEYTIRYHLSGDYKFLLTVCGMGAANSKYPCIYCLIDSQYLHVTSPSARARRIGEKGYSCARDPIFKSIQTEFVVIDTLHMYLRITDRFMKKIMQIVNELDLQETRSVNRCYAPEKMKRCAKMEDILKRAGVRGAPICYDKEAKIVKCRDLRGPEKLKVEKFLDDIEKLVDCHAHGRAVVNAWRRFRVLYDNIRSFKKAEAMSPDRPAQLTTLRNDLVEWYENLVAVCTSKIATPYMHLFVVHSADIIERLGSIHIFNAQGLEKLNDMTTTEYFRGTNHRKGVESLTQIMRRSNRRLYRAHKDIKLPRKSYRCGKCGQYAGHNCASCSHRTEL